MIKKIFAIAAIAAAMMSFASCEKTPVQGGENNGEETPADVCPDCQKNPCECEEVLAITIDGDFADWDNLEGVVVATLPKGDVKYEQLKTFKAYADAEFIYFFCEFDPENTLVFVPYFDLDNDINTGRTDKWSGAGYDGKAEGSVFEELDGPAQGPAHAWDPEFYLYAPSATSILASGMATISSVPAAYNGGSTYAFEASIARSILIDSYAAAYEPTLKTSLTVGMIQYDLDWSYIGMLPCKTLEEQDAGELETMLTVVLP